MRILGIHGLGDHRTSPWQFSWRNAIEEALPSVEDVGLEMDFFSYDQLFEQVEISSMDAIRAVQRLVSSAWGAYWSGGSRRSRGMFDSIRHKGWLPG